MLKFIGLFLKNLGRNKVRTGLTAMAVIVLVAIYTLATTVTDTINQMLAAHSSQSRLIVREKWIMPSQFPIRYVSKIAEVEGVDDWTAWHFYAGYVDDAGHAGAGLATRMDNLREMHPGLDDLDPALIEAVEADKTGALVGQWIMNQLDARVGQKFTVRSFTHLGEDLEFKIVGVLPSDIWARNFFFREDYYQEALGEKDHVNIVWLRTADEKTGRRVAAEVEQLFENAPAKLRVETESAGVGRFLGRTSTVVHLINMVVAILLIDMVVVLSNSINMTVRERRREMAILKILGFQPRFILLMIVGEAVTVGALGGLFGAGLAWGASVLNLAGYFPMRIDFLLQFPIPARFLLHGFVVGALVGFLGSIIPAWNARKVQVVEAFSNVG